MSTLHIKITDETHSPLNEAMVLVAYPNGTKKSVGTDQSGTCAIDLYRDDISVRLIAAASGHYPYQCEFDLKKIQGPVAITMNQGDGQWGNSAIFNGRTGYIPRIEGRLNPIHDTSDRYYLYGDSLAINGGGRQPVHFNPGEWLAIEDSQSMECSVKFIIVEDHFTLLEYTAPTHYQHQEQLETNTGCASDAASS
ncbi:MAG: hypothetical protein F4X64_16490 [Chloroflexi bacterium]|nr:hypothetical protein [Chloroflexota bacterium]